MHMNLTEESVARLLVGKGVDVSVGEPWDFESADGPNRLRGEIVAVETAGPEQSLTVRVTPFAAKTGETVDTLRATARYAEDLAEIVRIVADGGKASATLDYGEQVSPERLGEGSHPFLIGGVKLA